MVLSFRCKEVTFSLLLSFTASIWQNVIKYTKHSRDTSPINYHPLLEKTNPHSLPDEGGTKARPERGLEIKPYLRRFSYSDKNERGTKTFKIC